MKLYPCPTSRSEPNHASAPPSSASPKARMLCAIVSSLLSSSLFTSPFVLAFDSGSTGADGAFSPSVDTRLDLPESGVFNFSSLTIPEG